MNASEYCIDTVDVRPFTYAMSLINGKWKSAIMFWIWKNKVIRYNELKRCLGNISHKILSNQLKELESEGVISRKEYPQIPPKVEYTLTDLGHSLIPILESLCKWGHEHIPENWVIK